MGSMSWYGVLLLSCVASAKQDVADGILASVPLQEMKPLTSSGHARLPDSHNCV